MRKISFIFLVAITSSVAPGILAVAAAAGGTCPGQLVSIWSNYANQTYYEVLVSSSTGCNCTNLTSTGTTLFSQKPNALDGGIANQQNTYTAGLTALTVGKQVSILWDSGDGSYIDSCRLTSLQIIR